VGTMSNSSTTDLTGLRVVHAANLHFVKDGSVYFNVDYKLTHGLIQSGCFVYPFSINDRARMLSPTGSKTFGKSRVNKALIQTCRNVAPDVLLLGHAQYISRATLLAIRDELPDIRIGLWYIDPLWVPKDVQHLHDRSDLLDAIFATTGGGLLKRLSHPGCPAAFLPNPVEASIERLRAFENSHPKYDVVFIGSDKRAPERRKFLAELQEVLTDVRLGLFACLGNPEVFGFDKERVLASSRMALNLSRKSDVELYSSDRIAQLTGNGLLVLTPEGAGLDQLYSSDEIVYFNDVDDLAARVKSLKENDEEAVRIAVNGWRKSHQVYSARNIATFMIDLLIRRDSYANVPWAKHIYWDNDHAEAA